MQRVARLRAEILELLEDSTPFLSAQQIHRMLTEQDCTIALAAVHRALQALTGAGGLEARLSADGLGALRRAGSPGAAP